MIPFTRSVGFVPRRRRCTAASAAAVRRRPGLLHQGFLDFAGFKQFVKFNVKAQPDREPQRRLGARVIPRAVSAVQ
jgi:hypothetical protein